MKRTETRPRYKGKTYVVTSDEADDQTLGTSESEPPQLGSDTDVVGSDLATRSRWRRWLTVALVLLTVQLVVTTTVAAWVRVAVFDTDTFMELVQPALDDPALYAALSERVSEEVIVALNIEPRVSESLAGIDVYLSQTLLDAMDISDRGRAVLGLVDRPMLEVLAAPMADSLETRITEIVDTFITSDEFRAQFPELVREAHVAAVALLRDDLVELPNVYIDNGEVRLNLVPVITEAVSLVADEMRDFLPDVTLPDAISDGVDETRQQLAEAVGANLPEDFGQVALLSEQSLVQAQDVAHRLDRFAWFLVLFSIVLVVVTVVVSSTRRRTSIQLSLGVIAGLLIGLAAVRRLESAIVEQISNLDAQAAGRLLVDGVVSRLRTVAIAVVVVAVILAIAAYLLGRPGWIADLSDRWSKASLAKPGGSDIDLWIAARCDALRIAGIAAAAIILFNTGINLLPVVVVGTVLALYLWAISAAMRRASTEVDQP